MRHRALALLLIPCAAFATIFVRRPLQEEIRETPVIVRGTIGASYSDWGSDGSSKRIYTYYRLQVGESFKGGAGTGLMTIREMGGEKDGIGMQVAGAAHFSQKEDVVVFLDDPSQDGSYPVHGLSSGKLNLFRDSRGDDGAQCLSGVAVEMARPSDQNDDEDRDEEGDKGAAEENMHCSWTLASLRDAIREQGEESAGTPAPVPDHSVAIPSPTHSVPAKALQLQPSTSEPERGGSRREHLWKLVLAAALAAFGVLLLKLRR